MIGIDALAALLVAKNGCTTEPVISNIADANNEDGSTVSIRSWPSGVDGSSVQFWKVEGGGHVWPGERTHLPKRLVGPGNNDIDATTEIWKFFSSLPDRR